MKLSLVLFCIYFTLCLNAFIDIEVDKAWNQHKSRYGLDFVALEDEKRKQIFWDNYKFIEDFNSKNKSFKLGINRFGHLRTSEVVNALKMSNRALPVSKISLPVRKWMNWQTYGMVAPVKDQGKCDASYAFSGIGAVESHFAIFSGILEEFSAQEIVDCPSFANTGGCHGGRPDDAFEYVKQNGIDLEQDYPYTGVLGICKNKSITNRHTLLSFVDIPHMDEIELIRVLSFIGPVSITLDANHREFIFYKSGIIDFDECDQIDPSLMALAVGYDIRSEKPFLYVKNSWGADWGENGYFTIILYKNMCGLASYASYPIIKTDNT